MHPQTYFSRASSQAKSHTLCHNKEVVVNQDDSSISQHSSIAAENAAAMTNRSELISFVNRNGYLIRGLSKGSDAPELTHLLMDGEKGGKIAIPHEATDGFFAAYAKDLLAGAQLFVVEKRTPVFKFCVDVDFKTMYSTEDLSRFIAKACTAIAPYFTDIPGKVPREASCIVCAVTEHDGRRKAPGLHLIFPFAPVKESAACWIRSGIVHALWDLVGFQEDWNTVIDIAVITSSGLRMVGSDKCRNCSSCKNEREAKQCCSSCNRRGKLAENKIYWPWRVYPEDDPEMMKCLVQMQANVGHAARMCSIRLAPDVPESGNFRVPPMAPGMAVKKRSKPGSDPDKGYHLMDESPEFPRVKKAKLIDVNARMKALVTEAIHKYYPKYYARLEVKELLEHRPPKSTSPIIWVKVAGFGSRFCLNKNADHTSQSIYFVISARSGIAQRCFSRKDIERQCGKCANFTSNWKPIGKALRAALFPDETANVGAVNAHTVRPGSSEAAKLMQRSSHQTAELLSQLPTRLARPRQEEGTIVSSAF